MSALRRRWRQESSVEDERAALLRQRQAASEELELLKQELAERVRAVREKERQLDDALGRAGAGRTLGAARGPQGVSSGRERDLAAWEARLAERDRQLAAREALPPRDPNAAQLAQIDAKLAELKAAEQAFLRTQEELAVRSEAVAARERLVSERERELDAAEDGSSLARSGPDVTELEARLRRLERQSSSVSEDTQSFAKGLESLRRRGTRRPPTG